MNHNPLEFVEKNKTKIFEGITDSLLNIYENRSTFLSKFLKKVEDEADVITLSDEMRIRLIQAYLRLGYKSLHHDNPHMNYLVFRPQRMRLQEERQSIGSLIIKFSLSESLSTRADFDDLISQYTNLSDVKDEIWYHFVFAGITNIENPLDYLAAENVRLNLSGGIGTSESRS